jgi:hypothetical protein
MGTEAFFKSRPSGVLTLMRVCHKPVHEQVLARFFDLSSKSWDVLDSARVATGGSIKLRLVEASKPGAFDMFFASIASRMTEGHHWEALQPSMRTFGMGTVAFRMLSRVAGSVEVLLQREYTAYPFRLFRLLEEDVQTTAEIIAEEKRTCLFDDLSAAHRKRFPEEKLLSEENFAELQVLAGLGANDTVRIEARHATLRRVLLRAVQTHKRCLGDLAAYLYMLQSRIAMLGPLAKRQAKHNARGKLRKRKKEPSKSSRMKKRRVRVMELRGIAGKGKHCTAWTIFLFYRVQGKRWVALDT